MEEQGNGRSATVRHGLRSTISYTIRLRPRAWARAVVPVNRFDEWRRGAPRSGRRNTRRPGPRADRGGGPRAERTTPRTVGRRGLRHAAGPADVAADRAGLSGHDRRTRARAGGLADADPRRLEPHGGGRSRRARSPRRLPDPPTDHPPAVRGHARDPLAARACSGPKSSRKSVPGPGGRAAAHARGNGRAGGGRRAPGLRRVRPTRRRVPR